MLSIIIPIYNFDITKTVDILKSQLLKNNIKYEILCYDDNSKKFKEKNSFLKNQKNIIYKELDQNIGRAKIRNLLIKNSIYENLLMLDCDILINDNDFIKNYMPYFNTNTVVCGGVNYEKINKKNNLRFIYGINREVKKSKYRNRNPYRSFTAFNMLAPKKIFNKLSFYEDISSYGHEDTLLGLDLKKNSVKVVHIDNNIIHLGLDDNLSFIKKTEEGLKNLHQLFSKKNISNEVKIYKYYYFLKKFKNPMFYFLKKWCLNKLKKGSNSLIIFDLYKLFYLVTLKEDE